MVALWLLVIFLACTVLSVLLCSVAMKFFPKFRSGEYKPGPHRPDISMIGQEIKSIELPLVGGPALILSLVLTGILSGFLLNFTSDQWTLLLIGIGATVGYTIVGLIDDWHKVYSKEGLSERKKFAGVLVVSIGAALFYFFLTTNGKQSYSPYTDLPIIGPLLCPSSQGTVCPNLHSGLPAGTLAYFLWLLVLILISSVIGTVTPLSVDFSDGLDGLAGGLVFSSALAFGIIITGDLSHPEGVVLEVLSLLCAAGTLGYLPFNWPSSWAARRSTAKRRARIYLGDSGALGLGGILAMIALFSRQEWSLLMIGGAFVLEGLSALISAKILARRFFRQKLQLLRFASSHEFVPHTEFPLPFLATPLHHHFDLLGWDRRRLVYGAWALGAIFATLGVMVGLAPETWERYLGRILALIFAWLVWSSGSWTRRYFIGKHPAERKRRRRLALYYGYPYILMGIRLFRLVEIIEASENVIETAVEELSLWQRMNIYDARAMLGLYCYRAGYYPAALAQWTRIPEDNRILRPEIAHLLTEVDNRIALEKQETQPIRRDHILHPPPILSGNLPPADLPNPHTPVHSPDSDANQQEIDAWVTSASSSSFKGEEGDNEQRYATAPLLSNVVPATHSTLITNGNGHQASVVAASPASPRFHWLARLLRLSPQRGN